MLNQKMLRALKYNFRSVFVDLPSSNEDLFYKIKHCISLFNPEWIHNIKPSSKEDIESLERTVERELGVTLPPIYKRYLQEMGANDGELLTQYIFNLNYYSKINQFQTIKDIEILHFEIGDMTEYTKKCMGKIKKSKFANNLTSSFMWYLLPYEVSVYAGFAFTLNKENPNEIVMSYESSVICYDTFQAQLAYCEYLKVIHYIEDHSEPMKRKKWGLCCNLNSESLFCANFRAYCPTEWMEEEMNTGFPLYAEFLEKIEAHFFLEEVWFSRKKEFPKCDLTWHNDYHTFFSRYIAFSPISDLTLLIELHPKYFDYYNPFIQVHLLGKDVGLLNDIISSILEETKLVEIEEDKSRLFGKLDLE